MTYQTKNEEPAATGASRNPHRTASNGAQITHVSLPLHESQRFINGQLPHLARRDRDAD
jgi:hypothetical protein